MSGIDKERILEVAEYWARGIIDSWIGEYGAWDDVVQEYELTEEELEFIQNKINFIIMAEVVTEADEETQ